MTRISAVLLAAGASSRFGAPKMLALVGGEPLVARTARVLLEGGADELVVVLGAGAPDVARALEGLPVRTTVNPAWIGGMFSSVQAGLAAIDAGAERIAVTPADLAELAAEDVRRTFEAARSAAPGGLVVAARGGRRGHPLVFDASVAARLRAWPPERRLSELFSEPDLTAFPVDGCGPGVLRDVDVAADLPKRGAEPS